MILQGNSIRIPLADESVHAVVTSPPYHNLRDYGTASWVGGSGECDHKPTEKEVARASTNSSKLGGGKANQANAQLSRMTNKDTCQKCGATRIDNQIGLEPTISAYIAVMVQVFREIWRVLRPDGVCFVNLGDSYSGGKNGRSAADTKAVGKDDRTFRDKPFSVTELPAKNLCGIPWRVALALQDDGWILRSEIPWLKANAMPSSVTDRPGTAHEHVFMLVKSARYYYDNEAVRKPAIYAGETNSFGNKNAEARLVKNLTGNMKPGIKYTTQSGRALRTSDPFFDSLDAYIAHLQDIRDNGGMLVDSEGLPAALVVNSEAYAGAHFATFPRKLIAPLIKMTPERVCPNCGAAWVRVVEKESFDRSTDRLYGGTLGHNPSGKVPGSNTRGVPDSQPKTTGWRPTCKCGLGESECIGGIICDPFAGSGTVGQVATEHGRRFIGIDLSARYLAENALPRSEKKMSQSALSQLPMFKEAA